MVKDRIASPEEQAELARERGDLIQANALSNMERLEVPYLELKDLPWSSVPKFGYDHCNGVAMLAYEMGVAFGLNDRELQAVKLAGMLHDVGRTKTWQFPEPGHQKVSAEIAVQLLRGNNNSHAADWLRDRVEQLILGMDLSAPSLPTDPALQVLWDVDALEAARLAPGTQEGMRVWKARTVETRLCTQLARSRESRAAALRNHGWTGF